MDNEIVTDEVMEGEAKVEELIDAVNEKEREVETDTDDKTLCVDENDAPKDILVDKETLEEGVTEYDAKVENVEENDIVTLADNE